jgi:predicted peroxiredoxin
MKVLYIAATGTGDPTRASIPFHLAVNGSLEAGQEASVLLLGDAAELIVGDHTTTMAGVGLPPIADLVAKALDRRLPVFV